MTEVMCDLFGRGKHTFYHCIIEQRLLGCPVGYTAKMSMHLTIW